MGLEESKEDDKSCPSCEGDSVQIKVRISKNNVYTEFVEECIICEGKGIVFN